MDPMLNWKSIVRKCGQISLLIMLATVLVFTLSNKPAYASNSSFSSVDVYAQAGTDYEIPAVVGELELPIGVATYQTVGSWQHNPVTYSVADCPLYLDCNVAHQAIRDAAETWDSVIGLELDEVSAPGGDINIVFGDDGLFDGISLDGPGGILGYSYFPYPWLGDAAGDIFIDPDEYWVVTQPTEHQDVHLPTTILHEMGHSLGLDHTEDANALMWEEYGGVRGLTADDIAGAQSLYGPPSEADSATSQSLRSTVSSQVVLNIRSGPGTNYTVVGQLPANAVVSVAGKNAAGDWLYITHGGSTGWIATWLANISGGIQNIPILDADGNPSDTVPADIDTVTINAVAQTTLRIRFGPGTGYRQVGTLPADVSSTVVGRDDAGNWLLISYQGNQGWVAGWYCTVNGDINSLPIMTPDF